MKKLLIVILVITLPIVALHHFSRDFQTWTYEFFNMGDRKMVVYKWTDNKGVTHVTPQPPENNLPYIIQQISTNENIAPLATQQKEP